MTIIYYCPHCAEQREEIGLGRLDGDHYDGYVRCGTCNQTLTVHVQVVEDTAIVSVSYRIKVR